MKLRSTGRTTMRTQRDPMVRQTLVTQVQPSGLATAILPMRGFNEKMAALLVRYGALDLTFSHPKRGKITTTPGIAHFLEHELFKKGEVDALLEFGRFGASANAYTDYAATVYHFKGSVDFDRCLALLLDFTTSARFDEKYVERERLIIEQELRMYEDMPDFIAYRNLMKGLFKEHPLRIDIGGSVEDLKQITKPVLEEIYETFYRPSNMVLVVAGDVEPEAVLRQVQETVRGGGGNGVRRVTADPNDGIAARRHTDRRMASRSRVMIGFKDPGRADGGAPVRLDRFQIGIGLDLTFGRTSDFWRRHYESGLIDDSFSYAYRRELDFGFSIIGGETDEPERLADEVIKETRRLRSRRIKSRDVFRGRKRRIGRYLGAFDHPESAGFYVLDCLQHGFDVFGLPKALSHVRREGIESRLREHLMAENAAVSIVKPA